MVEQTFAVPLVELEAPSISVVAGCPKPTAALTSGENIEIAGAERAVVEQRDRENQARDAILRSLYDERASLLERDHAGRLSQNDRSYLEDIEVQIHRLETQEVLAAQSPQADVWDRLDRLATRLLTIEDELEALGEAE